MAKPKWITRDEGKVRALGPEAEVERHRAQQAHLATVEERLSHRPVMVGIDLAKPGSDRTVAHVYRGAGATARLVGVVKRELAEVDLDTLIARELARLADGRAQLWTCSIREALLARHLIEITEREDGRWAGDKITMKGERTLRHTKASRPTGS